MCNDTEESWKIYRGIDKIDIRNLTNFDSTTRKSTL